MNIKLTKGEAACLQHRLDVPYCLHEALDIELDDVIAACERFEGMLAAGRVLDLSAISPIERDVLADVVNGSTWAACSYEESPQVMAGARRTLLSVAEKLRAAGLPISPPHMLPI